MASEMKRRVDALEARAKRAAAVTDRDENMEAALHWLFETAGAGHAALCQSIVVACNDDRPTAAIVGAVVDLLELLGKEVEVEFLERASGAHTTEPSGRHVDGQGSRVAQPTEGAI